MAKLRLIHARTVSGDILVNDIDQGLPVEHLDEERKQDVYVTVNQKQFVGLEVVEDTATPGFIDLVLSDKVKLSREQGVIKGLEDAGLITVVDIATGALAAPTIATTEQDRTGGGDGTDDYRVEITGTNFLSTEPAVSTVSLTDGTTTVTLTAAEVTGGAGTFTDTSIIVPQALHGFATDGSEDVTSVTVTADNQSVTDAAVAAI
jgi:hypothetical protein